MEIKKERNNELMNIKEEEMKRLTNIREERECECYDEISKIKKIEELEKEIEFKRKKEESEKEFEKIAKLKELKEEHGCPGCHRMREIKTEEDLKFKEGKKIEEFENEKLMKVILSILEQDENKSLNPQNNQQMHPFPNINNMPMIPQPPFNYNQQIMYSPISNNQQMFITPNMPNQPSFYNMYQSQTPMNMPYGPSNTYFFQPCNQTTMNTSYGLSNSFPKVETEEDIIKKLKKINFNEENYKKCEKNEKISCPICLNDIEQNEEVFIFPCEHLFHTNCALNWLKIKTECPLCRHEL